MKYIFVLSLFFANAFYSQKADVQNVSVSGKFKCFPLVIMADSIAESKINTYLQVKYKGKFFSKSDYSIPEVCEQKEPYDWSYGIENDLLFLTIIRHEKNDFDSVPIYHYNEDHLSFDLNTGNIINIRDLFLKEKWIECAETFAKKEVETLHKNAKILNELKYSLNIENNDYNISYEDFKVFDEEYGTEPTLILNYPPQNPYSFSINDNKLHIYGVNALANKKISSLLPNHGWYDLEFTYDELKDYLSEYGKSVMKTSRVFYFKNGIDGKMVKGNIGNYKIHGIIKYETEYSDNYDNEFILNYWYDNHKEIIISKGKRDSNKIDLTEYNDIEPKNIRANLELDLTNDNKKLIGKWRDFKNKRDLSVDLEIY